MKGGNVTLLVRSWKFKYRYIVSYFCFVYDIEFWFSFGFNKVSTYLFIYIVLILRLKALIFLGRIKNLRTTDAVPFKPIFLIKWILFSIYISSWVSLLFKFVVIFNIQISNEKKTKNANMDVAIFHFAKADSKLLFFFPH